MTIDFHFPPARAMPAKAHVFEVRHLASSHGGGGGTPGLGHGRDANATHAAAGTTSEFETLVGVVTQGGHLATNARPGAVFRVREAGTAPPSRPLLERILAGYEAEQHVDIASADVILEFELAPSSAAGEGANVFWTWGGGASAFAREHWHAHLGSPSQRGVRPGIPPARKHCHGPATALPRPYHGLFASALPRPLCIGLAATAFSAFAPQPCRHSLANQ